MKTKYFIFTCLSFFLFSCAEKELKPTSGSLGKPGIVTEVKTEALPGGVLISYKIPNTEDIIEVKAIYTLPNGKTLEQTSSFYENKMELLGYVGTNEQEVTLYTINRAQEKSDPVKVKFTPLVASITKITESIDIISDFGGAQFSWTNEDKFPINLEFFTTDSLGRFQLLRVLTSESQVANFSLRGYAPLDRKFGILIRDNYGNASDTIQKIIIPYFEERFDKKKMNVMKLTNDENFTNWEGMDSYIIDDDRESFGHSPANSLPASFTIDMGIVANVSRVVFYNRNYGDSYYSWGNPKDIKIYGRKDAPSQSGNWDDWGEPLIVDALLRPSGLNSDTDEDRAFAEAGFEFIVPLTAGPLRYIRVTILSTQTGPTFTHPAEVDIYGEVIQ